MEKKAASLRTRLGTAIAKDRASFYLLLRGYSPNKKISKGLRDELKEIPDKELQERINGLPRIQRKKRKKR